MKNFYLAVTVEQDKNESILNKRTAPEYNPGYYSYIVKCSESQNVKSVLESIGGLLYANIFNTKKQATATVEYWNLMHKRNGKYLFDNPAF